MWGKVQSYAHQAYGHLKGGIVHAQRLYNKGMHLAGDLSGIYDVAKGVGGLLAEYGDAKLGGRQLTDALDAGVHWGDAMRSPANQKHDDVLNEINQIGTVGKQLSNIVSQGYNNPYTGG